MSEWVAIGLTIAGMLAGAFAWILRANMKPLKIVIENNTAALNLVSQTIREHTAKLADHEGRIIEIETTHDILDCKHNRRKSDREGR